MSRLRGVRAPPDRGKMSASASASPDDTNRTRLDNRSSARESRSACGHTQEVSSQWRRVHGGSAGQKNMVVGLLTRPLLSSSPFTTSLPPLHLSWRLRDEASEGSVLIKFLQQHPPSATDMVSSIARQHKLSISTSGQNHFN